MHIITEHGFCGRVRCSQLHGTRVVLLGDAAHAVTPVGGQGANAALQDCEVLDRVLAECGAPLGQVLAGAAVLSPPFRWRPALTLPLQSTS